MSKDPVVRYAIYPSIGIARVGNSHDEFFIGPESPGLTPDMLDPAFQYKDKRGAIKRQAARFRIYATHKSGAVEEINLDTPGVADIRWRVHVANKKATWYVFNNSMDLGDLSMDAQQRNHLILGKEKRKMLAIDPGAHTISGRRQKGEPMAGRFYSKENVVLGDLRTDESGRLLVLGGFGKSDSPIPGNTISNFSNNDGWHDDVSDGPVTATVVLEKGKTIEASPAWVCVTPPAFAPGLQPVTTLYDLLHQVNIDRGWEKMPAQPDFATDIYPILRRLSGLQWVAQGMDLLHGSNAALDFLDPKFIAELADKSTKTKRVRARVFDAFRDPSFKEYRPEKLPIMMGDGIDFYGIPRTWFAILPMQYEMLRQWKDGDFTNKDWKKKIAEKPKPIESYPVEQQPHLLTRGALDACLGGAFHPGIEITWPMRHARLYSEPYRLRVDDDEPAIEDFGPLLTPEIALSKNGPLRRNTPGDMTRWMGVPWQSDAASCQNIYVPQDFPLPVWWPSILPIDVLPTEAYEQVMETRLPAEQRQKFYGFRSSWTRGVGDVGYHALGGYVQSMIHMVYDWKLLGFVVAKPAPPDHEALGLPDTIFVETQRETLQD